MVEGVLAFLRNNQAMAMNLLPFSATSVWNTRTEYFFQETSPRHKPCGYLVYTDKGLVR